MPLKCILYPAYFISQYADNIKTAGDIHTSPCQIQACAVSYPPPFLCVHGFLWETAADTAPVFYFRKYEKIPVLYD